MLIARIQIPEFINYGSPVTQVASMKRFAQFYNMYNRGPGGTWPCTKCGPSPGCAIDFEAWREQPGRGCPNLAPQFGGVVCFEDAARSVACADACEGEPCLTKMDATASTAFGGGIYDPGLTDISPSDIGSYLAGIYTSKCVVYILCTLNHFSAFNSPPQPPPPHTRTHTYDTIICRWWRARAPCCHQ